MLRGIFFLDLAVFVLWLPSRSILTYSLYSSTFNSIFFNNAASKNFNKLRFCFLGTPFHHVFIVVCTVFIQLVFTDCGLCHRFVTIRRFWPMRDESRTWLSRRRWRFHFLRFYLRICRFQTESEEGKTLRSLVFVLRFDGCNADLAIGFGQRATPIFQIIT